MTLRKPLLGLVLAAALAAPAAAASPSAADGYSGQRGIIAILIGLLLPAVQKVR